MSTLPKVGIVGTGRMGANIAKRLHDEGYPIVALYDPTASRPRRRPPRPAARSPPSLARVTAAGRRDPHGRHRRRRDARDLSATAPGSLLANADGKIFVNCATLSPKVHVEVERRRRGARRPLAGSLHGQLDPAGPQRNALPDGRRPREVFERVKPMLEKMSASLKYIGEAGNGRPGQSAREHGDEHQHRRARRRAGPRRRARASISTLLREVFSQTGANSRVLETDGADMQNRDHDVYFSAAHAAKDSGIALALAAEAGSTLPLAQATFEQYETDEGASGSASSTSPAYPNSLLNLATAKLSAELRRTHVRTNDDRTADQFRYGGTARSDASCRVCG